MAKTGPVKSADRALEIVEILSLQSRPMAWTRLLRTTGYAPSSLYGLMVTLEGRGWVVRTGRGFRLQRGLRLPFMDSPGTTTGPTVTAETGSSTPGTKPSVEGTAGTN